MTLLKKVKTMSKEEIGKHLFLALVQTKNNHAFWNIASIENSWIYLYYVITNFRLEKSC